MYQFANVLLSKSKLAENSFLHLVNKENGAYATLLLYQSYDLKKITLKLLNLRGKKIPYNSKKFDLLRKDHTYSCMHFNLFLSYVHLFFTVALNFRLFKKYEKGSLSFGQILLHDSFKLLFDSHEQLILRRFNVIRNIFSHSASLDLFLLLNEDDFKDLHSLISSLISLETELLGFMRKNSFFDNEDSFYDLVNTVPLSKDNFPFIDRLLK